MCLVLSAAGGLGTVFTVTCNLSILPQAIPSLFLLLLLTHYYSRHLLVVLQGPDGSGRVLHGESLAASVDSDLNWKLALESVTSAPCQDCVS